MSVQLMTGRCMGLRSVVGLAAVLRGGQRHSPCAVYCGLAQPHVVCLRRGVWAKGRPVKLLEQGTAIATASGKAALRLLALGRLPGSRGSYEGAYHIWEGAVDSQRALQYA